MKNQKVEWSYEYDIQNAGASWNHQARNTATKFTHSLSVYKDKKGWTVETGGALPTPPEATLGGGQDDHLSERVSQVLKPIVNTWMDRRFGDYKYPGLCQ